jgi:3-oxoacyl-[acyl-carrier-protein] synthase II
MTTVNVIEAGAITPLGTSWKSTHRALLDGAVAPEPETVHGTETCLSRVQQSFSSDAPRFDHLARAALSDLLTECALPEGTNPPLVASTSKGGLGTRSTDGVVGLSNPGIWAGQLGEHLPSEPGRVSCPNTACATGLTALIQGARWIADDRVDHAIVVATESCFFPLLLAGYSNLGVFCDENGMRPFHPDRSGFALGEAAVAVLLANERFTQKYNLESQGSILGWGETCDAHHITKMEEDGGEILRAIELALGESNLTKDDVDLLHAHLTTTTTNDQTERKILESWPAGACLQGIKPALGHTIGAAGLLEVAASLNTLSNNQPFPMPTLRAEDLPEHVLHPNALDTRTFQHGVSWNMGFGGHNAAVVLEGTN